MGENQIATTAEQPLAPTHPRRGMMINTIEDGMRIGQAIIDAGFNPPGLKTPQAVMLAIQMGAEVGLSPMASLQNIMVVNNKPSFYGDSVLAICRGSGLFDEETFEEKLYGEGPERTASCTVRRIPGKSVTHTFSVTDAQRAKLWGTNLWAKYPDRMLQMRARNLCLRDAFTDILMGFSCAEDTIDAETILQSLDARDPFQQPATEPAQDTPDTAVDPAAIEKAKELAKSVPATTTAAEMVQPEPAQQEPAQQPTVDPDQAVHDAAKEAVAKADAQTTELMKDHDPGNGESDPSKISPGGIIEVNRLIDELGVQSRLPALLAAVNVTEVKDLSRDDGDALLARLQQAKQQRIAAAGNPPGN